MMNKLFKFIFSAVVVMLITNSTLVADEVTSAYLEGSFVDVKTAESKLNEVGFEVIATYSPVKDGTTIIFTNSALKAEAAKPKRAHAAILRLFIDEKEQRISFTNPIYFGKAFMQDDYNEDVFEAQLKKINSAFANLKNSADNLEFDDIAGFHFMMGMPYYEDPYELSEASNDELLAKAKGYKKGKLLIFELKLSDKSTLLGYEIGKKTKKFIKKTGRANAAVLLYCISIEDDVVTALAAKYYLAISYPQLTMGEFMTISTVPGAIEKDLTKPFK